MPILVYINDSQLTVCYNSNEIPDTLLYKAISECAVEISYKNDNAIRAVTIRGDYVELYSFLYHLSMVMIKYPIKIF